MKSYFLALILFIFGSMLLLNGYRDMQKHWSGNSFMSGKLVLGPLLLLACVGIIAYEVGKNSAMGYPAGAEILSDGESINLLWSEIASPDSLEYNIHATVQGERRFLRIALDSMPCGGNYMIEKFSSKTAKLVLEGVCR